MATAAQPHARRIEFCCPSELPYGQHVTIVAEPVRAGDGWLARISEITGVGEIRLAERVEPGQQLIVLGRKHDPGSHGGIVHVAATATAIEAMAEAAEAEVIKLLGRS